jgi:hypothetical protein
MKKKAVFAATSSLVVTVLSVGMIAMADGNANKVDYPEGYRQWPHVKSMVLEEGHPLYDSFGGLHHIYANAKALSAMNAGKAYPDGAVLVFDLLEARAENNAIVEGARKVVGVMQKDARKFAETGGWGFEGFKGDTRERVVTDAKTACFACHAGQKAQDYVFAAYRQ